MFDAQPVPPPPEVVRTESDYKLAAHRDMAMLYVRAAQSERALVRYQLFLRTDVTLRRGEGSELTCDWEVSPHLQREPCLESITGQLACAESFTAQAPDRERGQFKPADEEPASCGMEAPQVAAGRARLSAVLAAAAPTRFNDDLKRRLTPELAKAGVSVKPR